MNRTMRNLDEYEQQQAAVAAEMKQALDNDDSAAFAKAYKDLGDCVAANILAQIEAEQQGYDVQVLASRGVRQLTSEEREYFAALGEAMRTPNPMQAITDIDKAMPITTINAVFEDLKTSHPLLDVVDFQNTSGLTEILINTDEAKLGAWGSLTAKITEELTTGFKKINLTLGKYTAFLPVAKSMLDLGPEWLETYVRTVLQESIYMGLEEGIIKGDGKDGKPIGMIRKVGDEANVTSGSYEAKTPETVSALDPVTYGELLAKLAETPTGKPRTINGVVMIVSPKDYFSKVMPATTIRTADGTYINNVMPYPTKIIQSVHMDEGKMIIGLDKKYFMGIGLGKSGKIEHSDHVRFLDDERVYTCRLYGHGEPKDNNAFIYCDISDLQPAALEVYVTKSTAAEAAAVTSDAKSGKAVKE